MSNVTLAFFPPNTTSIVQPLDQGVIRAFKTYYRSRLVKHVISSCILVTSLDQVVITALDAIDWIEATWKEVTKPTIRNTFRRAGFQHHPHSSTPLGDVEEETNEVSGIGRIKSLDTLLSHFKIDNLELSAERFVMFDDAIPVLNEWEDDVETFIIGTSPEEMRDHDQEENDEVILEEPPSLVEALEMIRKLHLFVSIRQPELHPLVSDLGSRLTDTYIESRYSKQSSIKDFFSKVELSIKKIFIYQFK